MKKLYFTSLGIVIVFCMFLQSASAQIIFTDTYTSTQGNLTATQLTNWNTFRASLLPLPYSKMKVTGVTGSVTNSDSCMDPVIVQDIAMRLRTFTSASPTYTWVDGTRTWRVGNCGATATSGPELSMNQNICACTNPGRSVRGGCATCFNNNGAWGFPDCGNPTVTLTVEFFYGYPCTQTPTTDIKAPSLVCPGKLFTVDIDRFYADASYSWEYSDNGGSTWQPHPATVGAFSAAIQDAINAPRWYRCTVRCLNNSFTFTTTPWEVRIAPFYYCYCDNGAASTAGLDIGNVKVINMNSGDTMLNNGNSTPPQNNTTANRAYTNFQYPPNKEVIMYRDTVYRFLISQINSAATFTPSNVAVFIDLDRNGIFDPGERVLTRNINGGSQIPNTEFDTYRIPMTAQIGLTGMRVILSSGNIDSCGFGMAQGEVEDYLVDMRYEPCNGPGNAGTLASTSTKLCPGYDYITENAGYETTKSELQKVWQVSGDNIFWTTISNTSNKDTLMRVFSGQPLYYKVRMVCPRTKDTTYTSALKIDAREGYKCYCFSQAVGGNPKNSSNPKDSSDIGGIVFHTFNTNTGGAHLLNMGAQEKRTDHTDLSPMQLDVDSTYGLTVYHTQRTAVHGDAKITVFMDFNNDKEYDAPYERVYTGYTNVGNFTVVDKVTIPSTVITGVPTGMRIILNNDIGPSIPSDEACGPYTSGETEDLMVQFNKRFAAGVGIVGGISNLGVFPNPAKDVCKVQFSGAKDAKEVSVSITSVTGQKVYQQMYKHDGGNFTQEVNVAKLSRGVYYVEVAADGQKAMQKLVLE
ncbi:hypothetical protein CAP35_03025 [Chitinophagaceae bacterium IBVUCB1]|nr:hypothetical protein CAP35_03025 [Chitinophagaceae bacterium IBVUCB1]